jgi:hypothetical protein
MLEKVIFCFNTKYKEFNDKFFQLFDKITKKKENKLFFCQSNNDFYPKILMEEFSEINEPYVDFIMEDGRYKRILIRNETDITKDSTKKYTFINIDNLIQRFNDFHVDLVKIDHLGFNLPWFLGGIHPTIEELRNFVSHDTLYHTFPSGEPWDFIIPATTLEIKTGKLDYSIERKPKLEVVSFNKCSKPIIQFDVCCTLNSASFIEIFPEGLYDNNLNNIWIYIKNPYNIDLCIVINEAYEGDWSNFFSNARYLAK